MTQSGLKRLGAVEDTGRLHMHVEFFWGQWILTSRDPPKISHQDSGEGKDISGRLTEQETGRARDALCVWQETNQKSKGLTCR